MNRRQFIKRSTMAAAAVTLLPGNLPAQAVKAGTASTGSGVNHVLTKQPGTPDHALYTERQSDMLGLGPDGKPDPGYKATGIGVTPTKTAHDPSKPPHQMKLTQDEQNMIFEGYPLQTELDHLHVRLGGRNLDTRSCMCYLPEVGNAPKKGTQRRYFNSVRHAFASLTPYPSLPLSLAPHLHFPQSAPCRCSSSFFPHSASIAAA